MSSNCELSAGAIDQIRRNPVHTVLLELGQAARDLNLHRTDDFKKLIAYLLELADGRDRREPWVNKPGIARPVPRLRVVLEKCFGQYADLQWFRLNKITNNSGMPLAGLFPRMAASVARVDSKEFARLIESLVSDSPDQSLLKLLHQHGGKIKGVGLELFSRLAHAFRRDLYFVLPREWADSSGCTAFIDGDMRKYCALCRTLRTVCDRLQISAEIRGSVFDKLMNTDPINEKLHEALHHALGPSLAKYMVLAPSDAYEARTGDDDHASMPIEFAAKAIRARRGLRRLRTMLLQAAGESCAITGACPSDLLEVAYIVPFPDGDVHSMGNTLLLRSDIHTLWDLNLVGIDPDAMEVRIAPRLHGTVYEKLDGRAVRTRPDGARASRSAMRDRWEHFHATNEGREAKKKRRRAAATVETRPAAAKATLGAGQRETVA